LHHFHQSAAFLFATHSAVPRGDGVIFFGRSGNCRETVVDKSAVAPRTGKIKKSFWRWQNLLLPSEIAFQMLKLLWWKPTQKIPQLKG